MNRLHPGQEYDLPIGEATELVQRGQAYEIEQRSPKVTNKDLAQVRKAKNGISKPRNRSRKS